jgi:hypothetical protein
MRPHWPSEVESSILLGLDTIFGTSGQRVHRLPAWWITVSGRRARSKTQPIKPLLPVGFSIV